MLVVRSLQHALSLNLGFNPDHAVAVSFDLHLQGYNSARSRRFDADLLQKASAIPGLQSMGVISNLPLRAGEDEEVISRADRSIPKRSEWRSALVYNISPGYLKTAEPRVLLGRDVNDHDREGAPRVAIVNEALAHLLFGRENPLGRDVRMGEPGHNTALEVIGVVETGKYDSLGENPKPATFLLDRTD